MSANASSAGPGTVIRVLVGDVVETEDIWRRRSGRSKNDVAVIFADKCAAALECVARVAERFCDSSRANAPSPRDCIADWKGRAAAGGTDDTHRLAIALLSRSRVDLAAAIEDAFGAADEEAAIRALRAALQIDPDPAEWLLIASDQAAAASVVWFAEELAHPAFHLAIAAVDWEMLVATSPRAAARCAVEYVQLRRARAEPPQGPPAERLDPELEELRERARNAVALAATNPSLEGDAMSAAEAFLFAVLERRPPTAGRFALDGRPGFAFGPGPCRVDLFAQADRVALEIDGPYHFADLDAYRRDRRKDLLLQQNGYTVVRVLALDIVDRLETILDTIDATLGWKTTR